MTLLLTGGSGFIGSALVRRLDQQGQRGVILDLWPPASLPEGWRFERADVRDPAAVTRAAAGCEGIFHLAAAHHDRGVLDETYFTVNRDGTAIVAAAAAANRIERVCFLSSVAVYGEGPEEKDESMVPAPSGPYGASKWAGEQALLSWGAAHSGRHVLILRPTAVIGPDNFANLFALCAYLDRPVYVSVGDGGNFKSLAYVENLVSACLLLWNRSGAVGVETFNYADKPDLSSAEIMREIRVGLGRSPEGLRVPEPLAFLGAIPFELGSWMLRRDLGISRKRIRKLTTINSVTSVAKLRAAGFVPEISLRDGLRQTVAWYKAEGSGRTPVRRIPPVEPHLA